MAAAVLPSLYKVGDVVKHLWTTDNKFYVGKVPNCPCP